jgi:hypothetical protein
VVALLPIPLTTGEEALKDPGRQASSSAAPAPARSRRQQKQLRRARVGTSTEQQGPAGQAAGRIAVARCGPNAWRP